MSRVPKIEPQNVANFCRNTIDLLSLSLDEDECKQNPCKGPGAFCVNSVGSYECFCKAGFQKVAGSRDTCEGMAKSCQTNLKGTGHFFSYPYCKSYFIRCTNTLIPRLHGAKIRDRDPDRNPDHE